MNEIVIRESKKKVIEGTIMSLFMVFMGIFVLVNGLIDLSAIFIIIGLLGTIFSSAILIFIIKGIKTKRPLLIIGEDGITDMSTLSSIGLIPWEEIKSIEIQKMFADKFIGVDVYDLGKVMKRSSFFSKVNIKSSMLFKHAPLYIRVNTADVEISVVLSLMQKRLDEYRTR